MNTRKRLWAIKRFIDTQNGVVTFAGYDVSGEVEKPIDGMHLRVEFDKLSAENQVYAGLFGLNQTVSDTAALPVGATIKQKFDAMRERAEHLESGSTSWSSERAAGEGSILFAALMLEKPERDPIKLRAKLKELGPSKTAAMLNRPTAELAPFIEQVRKERGKEVDTDALFAELDV